MTLVLRHPLTAVILTVIAVFYYLSLDKSAGKVRTSSDTVTELEQEVAAARSEVAQLEQKVEVASHPIAKEKIIRNELLMQKSGEYVLQLPDIEVQEKASPPPEQKSPWQEWKEILF